MNRKGNGLIIAVIVLAVLCVVFLAGGYMLLSAWGGGFAFWKNLPERIGKLETYTIDQVHEVDVDDFEEFDFGTVSSNIDVFFTDSDEITVELKGTYRSSKGQVELVKEELGDKVKIYVDYPKLSGVFSWNNTGMKITMPRDMENKNVEFGTVSGKITIPESLSVENLKVGSTSGNVKISGLSCEDMDYDNVSGKLDFTGDVSGGMDLNSVSGHIQVAAGASVKEIDAETVSGNVTVTIPSGSDFKYSFNSVSGNIDCDFPVFTHGSKNEKSGYTDEKAKMIISVNTVSGNLDIE